MKLLYCQYCNDVVQLDYQKKACQCGRAEGKYMDDGINAQVKFGCRVLCINNLDLADAIKNIEHNFIRCWIAPADSKHVHYVANIDD
jgi:hypothetical protein